MSGSKGLSSGLAAIILSRYAFTASALVTGGTKLGMTMARLKTRPTSLTVVGSAASSRR